MAMIIIPPKRVCDICGADMTTGTAYQFSIPSVLVDNDGTEFKAVDSSLTDVCPKCVKERATDIVATVVAKAAG